MKNNKPTQESFSCLEIFNSRLDKKTYIEIMKIKMKIIGIILNKK